jgi:hypothetical protein
MADPEISRFPHNERKRRDPRKKIAVSRIRIAKRLSLAGLACLADKVELRRQLTRLSNVI